MKLKHYATVKQGKLILSNREQFSADIKKFEGKNFYLVADEEKQTRSNNQNSYYWGVVLKILADELGYTIDEMHEVLKYKFLPKKEIDIKGEKVKIGSSAKLKTDEFEKYLEEIRIFASTSLGITIPLPNEVHITNEE